MAKTQEAHGNKRESDANGTGGFYHIEIKSLAEFKRFRAQDVGKKGGIERVGGQRSDGTWETVKWLVGKEMAHIEDGRLIADHNDAQELFDRLETVPRHIELDRFNAKV